MTLYMCVCVYETRLAYHKPNLSQNPSPPPSVVLVSLRVQQQVDMFSFFFLFPDHAELNNNMNSHTSPLESWYSSCQCWFCPRECCSNNEGACEWLDGAVWYRKQRAIKTSTSKFLILKWVKWACKLGSAVSNSLPWFYILIYHDFLCSHYHWPNRTK